MIHALIYRKGRLYLVFEYIEKNLLEIMEENTAGIDVTIYDKINQINLAKEVEVVCILNDKRSNFLSLK